MASVWHRARIWAWVIAGGLGAEILDDLVLDRQAVAVPARHVRAVEPGHRQRSDDDVLEHLVEQGPHVDLAVGVRGTVVQDLARPAGTSLPDLFVKALLVPPGLDLRLSNRQVRLHVEARHRQIERFFVGLGVLLDIACQPFHRSRTPRTTVRSLPSASLATAMISSIRTGCRASARHMSVMIEKPSTFMPGMNRDQDLGNR